MIWCDGNEKIWIFCETMGELLLIIPIVVCVNDCDTIVRLDWMLYDDDMWMVESSTQKIIPFNIFVYYHTLTDRDDRIM